MKYSLFIFDKDGTLVKFYGHRPANTPEEQILLPGRKEKIKELKKQGARIAIASNQGGVAWGFISYRQAEELLRDVSDKISGADAIRFCPHDERAAGKSNSNPEYAVFCRCRKPEPGMLISILEEMNIPASKAVYIGDREEDRYAAIQAGMDFIWADDFFNDS